MKPNLHVLKRTVARLPICGQVFLARSDSLKAAATELLVITLFSLLPIWLYPGLLYLLADKPFWETAKSCVERGELYLYSAALLGPLIYSVSKQYGAHGGDVTDELEPKRRSFPRIVSFQFPHGISFSVAALLVCVFSAGAFALVRARSDEFFVYTLNEETTLTFSVLLYCFTLFCLFCALVYRLDLEVISNRFEDDTKELSDQWRNRN